MVRKFVPTVLSILVALASVAPSFAQTGPTGGGPMIQPTPIVVSGLSETDLLNCLRGLDPNVKVTPIKDGTSYYLTLRRDGWQYDLRISSFAGSIWLDSPLGAPIANVQSASPALLAQLLEANFKIGPTHFSLVKQNDGRMQLYLGRMLERGPLTADMLHNHIDGFCKQVRDMYPTWSAFLAAAK